MDRRLLALVARRLYLTIGGLWIGHQIATVLLVAVLVAGLERGFTPEPVTLGTWVGLGGLILLRLALAGYAERVAVRGSREARDTLRARLWGALLRHGPRGDASPFVSAWAEGVPALDAYFANYLPQVIQAATLPIVVVVLVAIRDPLSGLLLLITGPLIPVFMALIGARAKALSQSQWRELVDMGTHLLDLLRALPVLRRLGRADDMAMRLADRGEAYRKATMRVLRLAFVSALALELIATLSTAVVAVQVGLRLLWGHMSFGPALFVLVLAPEFYRPLRRLGSSFHAGMGGVAAYEAIAPMLEGDDAGRDEVPVGPVVLDEVRAGYGDGPDVLDRVHMTLTPGELTVITGPSGAGKSTLVRVITGALRPRAGSVRVGEVPLAMLSHAAWRRQVAYVPQHPHLIHGTLEANLRLAAPDAASDDLDRAIAEAGLDALLEELPDGLQTIVGEAGARLSGGQRRRLAIARALLRRAPVIVLDEPTAHLDPATAAQIVTTLRRLSHDPIVLVITHRDAVAAAADRAWRLRGGRVRPASPADFSAASPAAETLAARGHQGPASPRAAELRRPALLDLLRHARLAPWRWVGAILLNALTVASGVLLMGAAGGLIASAALHPTLGALQLRILAVRASGTGRGAFRYVDRLVSHDLSFRWAGALRVRLLRAFLRREDPDARAGALHARAVDDIGALERLWVEAVIPPVAGAIVFVGVIAYAWTVSAVAALGLGLGLAASAVGAWLLKTKATTTTARESEAVTATREATADVVPALWSVDDGAAYDLIRPATRALDDAVDTQARLHSLWLHAHDGLRWLVAGVLALLATQHDPVAWTGVTLAALAVFEGTESWGPATFALARGQASARGLAPWLSRTNEGVAAPVATTTSGEPTVIFDDVSFAYPGGPPLFTGLSFSVGGEAVAVVGPSGVGKSTLAALVAGRLRPTSGRIEVGGRPAEPGRVGDVAWLGQDPHFIVGSVAENLRLAAPEASEADLIEAATRAGIHERLAALPEGYDTLLREDARRLSGGERRRLALAQILLREAPVVILDEPTAHLDPTVAEQIRRDVLAALDGRAVLWLSHEAPAELSRAIQLGRRAKPDAAIPEVDNDVSDR